MNNKDVGAARPPVRTEDVIARLFGAVFVVFSILWAFQVPGELGIALFVEQFLVICLGLAGAAVFLTVRIDRTKTERTPWYDWLAAALFFGLTIYIAIEYSRLLLDAPYDTDEMVVLGVIVVVLVMEGLRRVAGLFLFTVVAVFIVYGLLAHLVPAPLTGTQTGFRAMANYLAFDINSLLGTPLVVATSIVVLFIFLGQTLFVSASFPG